MKPSRLLLTLLLSLSSGLSAELLTLERDGTAEIIAKIRATMNAETASSGGLIPWEFSYRSEGADRIVQLESPVALGIRENGEDSNLSLYKVKVNSRPAIMVLGDEQMRLSFFSRDSYSRETQREERRRQVVFQGSRASESMIEPEESGEGGPATMDTIEVAPDLSVNSLNPPLATVASATSTALTLYVFKHNDVRENITELLDEHFTWWADELNTLSRTYQERSGQPLFSELIIDFRTDEVIQNFEYKGDASAKLASVTKEFWRYRQAHQLYGPGTHNKYLLLTESKINWRYYGMAYLAGQYGIASDNTPRAPAHEIGHMLDAHHDTGGTIYYGWWCETNMYGSVEFIFPSCRSYTPESLQKIENHLSQ